MSSSSLACQVEDAVPLEWEPADFVWMKVMRKSRLDYFAQYGDPFVMLHHRSALKLISTPS
jgi:hypothetical protein